MKPSRQGYTDYMNKIVTYAKENEAEEILSIQTFACHGIINEGSQRVLINQKNVSETYYEMIDVEILIRT